MTDENKSLVPNLHDELAAQKREIAMLREELRSRPAKTVGCPDCGVVGLHGCTGKRATALRDLEPMEVDGNKFTAEEFYKK